MNPFSFLIYDIKRLFGHGKTAILAIFSPVLILLLFATFLAPMLSAGEGTKITCAFLHEDETESVKTLMDLIIGAEIDDDVFADVQHTEFGDGFSRLKTKTVNGPGFNWLV